MSQCKLNTKTAKAVAQEIGERLKRARLNKNQTQQDIASRTGLSRRAVAQAESGQVTLENMITILQYLSLDDQLELFLPKQYISPIQVIKMHGKIRQRASKSVEKHKSVVDESLLDW